MAALPLLVARSYVISICGQPAAPARRPTRRFLCSAERLPQGFVLQIALAWYPLLFAETSMSRRNCVLRCATRPFDASGR